MLKSLKGALAAVAALGALATASGGAAAMPMIDHAPAVVAATEGVGAVQPVRWVCGPYRCFFRPNYWRPYPVYGYGWHRWHRPSYGWHRPYGYGRRYGWHRW